MAWAICAAFAVVTPSAGSTGMRATASGRFAATSSMSMPPSAEAMARKRPAARSRT